MIRIVFILFFIFTYFNVFCQEITANLTGDVHRSEKVTNIVLPPEDDDEYNPAEPYYPASQFNIHAQDDHNVQDDHQNNNKHEQDTVLIQVPVTEPVFEQEAEQITITEQKQNLQDHSVTPVLTPAQMQPPETVQTAVPQTQTTIRTTEPAQTIITQTAAANTRTNNDERRLVLVNQEIVHWIQQLQSSGADIKKLIFYLSKSFTMEIDDPNIEPKIEILGNGMLMISDQANMAPIRFTTEQQGTLRNFVPESNDTFIINLQTQNNIIPLKFRKNNQADFYELYAIEFATGTYILRSNEQLPHLYIFASINRNQRVITSSVQAVPITASPAAEVSREQQPARQLQPYDQRSRYLIAQGTLTKETVFNFIKSRNVNPYLTDAIIRQLIDLYFNEASYERINHDIAIVQMLHVTNFLRNRQYTDTNNFGGLNTTREWNGRFANMETGVRAHIQHLRAYASTAVIRQQIVNPRMSVLTSIRGTVQTIDQLYEKWTTNPQRYKANIDALLRDIYSFSANR
ncbi:MAG: glucosaminidase domain-containing protein [Treponema sp.]|nr:glucosaminidase domain-containing protein [Treponema sp.]MCL2250358.1 glucosaminidase domain-containing protein [Treponema sp.]